MVTSKDGNSGTMEADVVTQNAVDDTDLSRTYSCKLQESSEVRRRFAKTQSKSIHKNTSKSYRQKMHSEPVF